MPQEKIRVYALARELNMESKDLLDICRDANISVRNQLSNLEPEQRDLIIEMVRRGGSVATQTAPPPSPSRDLPPPPSRMRNLSSSPRRKSEEPAKEEATQEAPVAEAAPLETESVGEPVAESSSALEAPETVESEVPVAESAAATEDATAAPEQQPATGKAPLEARESAATAEVESKPAATPEPLPSHPVPEKPAAKAPAPKPAEEKPSEARPSEPEGGDTGEGNRPADRPIQPLPGSSSRPVRNLSSRNDGGSSSSRERKRPIPGRGGSVRLATPPPLKPTPKPAAEEKKPQKSDAGGARKIQDITPDMMKGGGSIFEKMKETARNRDAVPIVDEEEEDGDRKKGGGRGKQVPGRNQRHRDREQRGRARRTSRSGTALLDSDVSMEERGRGRRQRRPRVKRPSTAGTKPRKDEKIPVEVPISVRSLSEAIGVSAAQLVKHLMEDFGSFSNINSVLEPEVAETLADTLGYQIEIKKAPDLEEQIQIASDQPDDPEHLEPRAPIVTIMGHVDHGKTSLLDQIRKSNVVDTEVGGITQSLRAWRVEHDGHPVTFLDTPGHAAFTQMRARGANVTDIAVIVVAADDGVMPQTEEAISHAKASDVAIVVAINKIDLPNANVQKTEQQLYGLELIPDTMGGDVPFVYTSASTGEGIDQLLEMLSVVAELKELSANPNKPGQGICLEATVNEKEGVTATVLVQEGTLRRNDVVLCGSSYGTARAMFDDLGRPIEEAGPSCPVRVLGLDEVPNADDPFVVVTDVATAGKVAEKRKKREQEEAHAPRGPLRLEDLGASEVAELKVILKADVKGSLEAIRKELEKLEHDEVRVKLLMTAVGGITENDVNLAMTSPEDTIIVGFNVVPDERAQSLADERGIQIRQYNIIYNLTNDIREALEGKLKPREEIQHLGRAVVRETFKISRTGTIAGCYVTQGTIERNAMVRVIRNGVVVYPPADRNVGLDSLKRFKDDAKEVQQGYECGLKITGYDDIKVDDVIEAFRIEKIKRTLE